MFNKYYKIYTSHINWYGPKQRWQVKENISFSFKGLIGTHFHIFPEFQSSKFFFIPENIKEMSINNIFLEYFSGMAYRL